MPINVRNTTIEGKDCLIHLPERPNGFAILLLGDRNQYVKNSESLWLQNSSRYHFLQRLLHEGYTVFYCDLGGPHWGSDKAFQIVERLVNYVIRTEIINDNIHLFAEGMGALLAFRLIHHPFIQIRSLVLYNPCIDLMKELEMEKTNRFFYKRLVQELEKAYGIEEKNLEEVCVERKKEMDNIPTELPLRVFQVIYQGPYSPDDHIRPFLNSLEKMNSEMEATFFMPGKTMKDFTESVIIFYKKQE